MSEASATPQHRWAPERIVLRRLTPTFAFADVRFPAVNLIGLRVEATHGGLRITEPVTTDKYGRTWPAFRLQPHYREALAREIAVLWDRTA
jgi:hypothetical protein